MFCAVSPKAGSAALRHDGRVSSFPELEWLQLRRDGLSCALIASGADVSEGAVRRATQKFGPFPVPDRRANGRLVTRSADVAARTAQWVALRRAGISATQIAREAGFTYHWVSKATLPYGPFPRTPAPTPADVKAWATARRSGASIAQVAEKFKVPNHRVELATRAHGPFPRGRPRIPAGLLGRTALARRLGIAHPSLRRWSERGLLPAPDFVTARGRELWRVETIESWIADADLHACPDCGALVRKLGSHRTLKHGQTGA